MSDSRPASTGPPLVVFLLLASLSVALLLRAWLDPPRGTTFAGTFAYLDDYYNYLSMVEQAERGVLVFQSKMASPALPAALVNLEWLTVGRLAAVLGGRILLAYRIFGLVALAGLIWAADRWLTGCGVARERRLSALLVVFTGGGLGGLLYWLGLLPGERALDLRTGAYPFVEALSNPHFTAGTALLSGALLCFASGRRALGALLGAVLGLVRPYDAALLGAVEAAAILLLAPPREWWRRAWPLLALVPALLHNEWVFRASPAFRAWVNPHYADLVVSPLDWLILLAPGALLALGGLALPGLRRDPQARPQLLRLWLWTSIALAITILRPVSFSLQFGVGIGLPLLLLAATTLARRRYVLELALPLLATSAVVYTSLVATPSPRSHPPSERFGVARALRSSCRPGEIVLAPEDIGLYVGGLTACWPYVSHPAAPDYPQRLSTVRDFYAPEAAPVERARLLDRACITHVALPAGAAAEFLGDASPFRPSFAVGSPNGAIAVWSRRGRQACASSDGGRS